MDFGVGLLRLPGVLVALWEGDLAVAGGDSFDPGEAFFIEAAFGDGVVREGYLIRLAGDGVIFLVQQLISIQWVFTFLSSLLVGGLKGLTGTESSLVGVVCAPEAVAVVT